MSEPDLPPIEPGKGRLIYDKARRTIISERPSETRIDPKELVAAAMIRCSLATGHGDTLESLLDEMEWQVKRLQNRVAARPVCEEQQRETT